MANLIFDIGCIPTPLNVSVRHPSEQTAPERGFTWARKYAEVEFKTVSWRYSDAPPGVWSAALMHWDRTFGGALRMDWTPPDGTGLRVVRFAKMPKMEKRGARLVTFMVELEDAP